MGNIFNRVETFATFDALDNVSSGYGPRCDVPYVGAPFASCYSRITGLYLDVFRKCSKFSGVKSQRECSITFRVINHTKDAQFYLDMYHKYSRVSGEVPCSPAFVGGVGDGLDKCRFQPSGHSDVFEAYLALCSSGAGSRCSRSLSQTTPFFNSNLVHSDFSSLCVPSASLSGRSFHANTNALIITVQLDRGDSQNSYPVSRDGGNTRENCQLKSTIDVSNNGSFASRRGRNMQVRPNVNSSVGVRSASRRTRCRVMTSGTTYTYRDLGDCNRRCHYCGASFRQPGYHTDLTLKSANGVDRGKRITMLAYYDYQLHFRLQQYDLYFRGCRVFQQYVVDVFCAVEQNRLDFIRKKQKDIQSDYLSGLYDVISRGERDGYEVGGRIILPMSFTGGPRYMYTHYLDAFSIYRKLGNPQFFITFTCNINWPKIERFMSEYPHLTAFDRANVVCRVFEQNIQALIAFLREERVFGIVTGAELLDPRKDPEGYNIISELMMHGPCGAVSSKAPCHFICAHEAYWRILKFDIHRREPAVQILAVHLEDMQRVTFRDQDRKSWSPRKNSKSSIGRLAYVHLTLGELFFLRMLPCHQKGYRDFWEMQTINDVLIDLQSCELIFVYGHGGTGKTFLWKTIISSLRYEGKIVLIVVSSGIASLLLPYGRTLHSRFKLPLELTEESLCRITKNTQLGKLLPDTDLIIWYEDPMSDCLCFKALDRSLRDIVDKPSSLFGEKSVLLGVFTLKHNMRLARPDISLEETSLVNSFASWLLDVGDGKIGEPADEDPTKYVLRSQSSCILFPF
uniref:ATP-dependent DNA helicase n=1 Tax=Tanacetum cinerariifolium TaxID=118510 RepID=A0A6L2NEB8_TANCI|nr:DNA helicase [Tanacetum cinerariifolium]